MSAMEAHPTLGRPDDPWGPASPSIDRRLDRRITATGIAAAAAFLLASALSTLLPEEARRGAWLPIHLGLAGGATVAIASVMPFFAASLAVARPVDPVVRLVGIVLPLAGIVGVETGLTAGPLGLAQAGGIVFLVGIGFVAIATFAPLAGSGAPRRAILAMSSGAALADVTLGAILGTLYAASVPAVLADWANLKPAHAWLNVLGFVGGVVSGTLVHLWPTVLGTRIRTGPAVAVLGIGWVFGPPLVALGFALHADVVARMGALVVVAGALGLAVFALRQWSVRGRWTTDAPWHLAAIGHMGAAIAWSLVGSGIAASMVIAHGATPDGWSVAAVAAPLGAGWIAQTIVAAWTHLLPTAGPGDPVRHAAQRRTLGRWSATRLVTLQAGVALLAVGLPLGIVAATAAGALLAGGTVAVAAALLVAALRA